MQVNSYKKTLLYKNSLRLPLLERFSSTFLIFLTSCILLLLAKIYNTTFSNFMSVSGYLTWHNTFELFSAVISLSIFLACFFTYTHGRNLRLAILGCAFLNMGLLDIFHALSFKGMPRFIVDNLDANRATTIWVISRIIGSSALLIAGFVKENRQSSLRAEFFILPTVFISLAALFVTTYLPSFLPAMYIEGTGITFIKKVIEYVVLLLLAISMVNYICLYKSVKEKTPLIYANALLISMFSEFAFISYASVYDTYNYLGHIFKCISYIFLFRVIYVHNILLPYNRMEKAQKELSDYVQNLDIIVKTRTQQLESLNSKLLEDLEYARDVQKSLMPLNLPDDNKISFIARYLPAEHLSGDFYNVLKIDESQIAFYIGDVSGHGVPAAMLTIFANQNINSCQDAGNETIVLKPSKVLSNLYKAYNKTNFKDETYIVLMYGVYNTETRVMKLSSAGLNVTPLILHSNGDIEEIDMNGFAIFKLGEFIEPVFEERNLQLEIGDRVLFFTDGLVEAQNAVGQCLSKDSFYKLLQNINDTNNSCLADCVVSKVLDHIGKDSMIGDDITLLMMEIK